MDKTCGSKLDGWSRFLVTIAPAITPVLIIAAVALIVGLLLGTAEKARGLHISAGAYLAGKFAPRKIFKFISNNIIIVLIMIFAVVVAILKPNFAGEDNIRNLLSNTAVRFIIALGVSGCLITKGTDLSAGRVAGLAACISAILLQRGDYGSKFYPGLGELPIPVVLLIVLGICAIIGIINGSVISFFKVPPFIATLGMQTLVYGICLVYTGASHRRTASGLHQHCHQLRGKPDVQLYSDHCCHHRRIYVVPVQQNPPRQIHVCHRRE